MNKEPIFTFFNFMGFRNFGKTQLGKYSANLIWEGVVKRPLQGLVNALTRIDWRFDQNFPLPRKMATLTPKSPMLTFT